MSMFRFESGKKVTFWNPPPPRGDLVGGPTSFALLFVKNYAILELSDKIYTGGNIWG